MNSFSPCFLEPTLSFSSSIVFYCHRLPLGDLFNRTHNLSKMVRILTLSLSSGKKTFFHKGNFTPGGYGIVNRLLLV